MYKLIIFISLFLLIFIDANCQMLEDQDSASIKSPISQPNRIEFEYGNNDLYYHIVTAEDKGILVVQETTKRSKEGFVWQLHLLDTTLAVSWKKELIVKYGWSYIGYDFNQSDFILLFSTSDYNMEDMVAMKVTYDGEQISSYEINTVVPLVLSHFEVVDNALIFGGTAQGRPVIIYYDLFKKRPKVLPGIYNNNSSIVSVETSDKYKLFSVSVSEKTETKDYTISLKVFSSRGDLIYSSKLETELEKSLVDAVSTYFKNGVQFVSGTYANRKTDRSLGFYLTKLRGGQQEFIKYHPYADLYNFFSYLKEKQKKRVKKRINRKKIRGKNVKLNYRLLVHEIVRKGEEFILIGEAYYPKYKSDPFSTMYMYDPYNFTPDEENLNRRFEGYQYTHAVVVGFNEDGEILWDNSFEISDVLLPSLEKNIQVNIQGDNIILLYTFDDTIRSKMLTNGEMLEGKTYDPIRLQYENDELKEARSDIDGLKEWYDGAFYVYGDQKIKNTVDQGVDNNRRVFYINKVILK